MDFSVYANCSDAGTAYRQSRRRLILRIDCNGRSSGGGGRIDVLQSTRLSSRKRGRRPRSRQSPQQQLKSVWSDEEPCET